MSLKRRVAALEKHQAELTAITRAKAQQHAAGNHHAFWEQVELKLQAKRHWSNPGEDFFRYVSKGIGFDYARYRQAFVSKDRRVLDEFMKAIFQQFPNLKSAWLTAVACP